MTVKEKIKIAREYLSLEEVQLAIGEVCMSGTGLGLMTTEIALGRFSPLPLSINAMVGYGAALYANQHIDEARELMKRPQELARD